MRKLYSLIHKRLKPVYRGHPLYDGYYAYDEYEFFSDELTKCLVTEKDTVMVLLGIPREKGDSVRINVVDRIPVITLP